MRFQSAGKRTAKNSPMALAALATRGTRLPIALTPNADCVQAQPGEGAVCQWHTTKAPTEAAAKTQGEEPWSPSAEGEIPFP